MPHQPMSAPPHAPLANRDRARTVHSVVLAALWLPTLASAHGGHGPSGAHWHPTDAWGLLMLAAVFAASVWWARRK
jgi:hypothetical protein